MNWRKAVSSPIRSCTDIESASVSRIPYNTVVVYK